MNDQSPKRDARSISLLKSFGLAILTLTFLDFIVVIFFPLGGTPQSLESKAMLKSRTIELALWQYAQDHGGKYPEGKSSTEVFQQLLDGKFISDSSTFYFPMPGKVKPEPIALKPNTVSFDMTCCIDPSSPDNLPAVFITGYKIVYQAGANAVLWRQPTARTWSDWWYDTPHPVHFIAFSSVDNSARSIEASPDGTIPNFIPADFDPKGKTYRQLTPDGELPP